MSRLQLNAYYTRGIRLDEKWCQESAGAYTLHLKSWFLTTTRCSTGTSLVHTNKRWYGVLRR